jgi:glycerophosphoryl diester phosphodiesterase
VERVCNPGDSPMLCKRHQAIAHRGGGRLAPEETLPAYANAAKIGVDVLELDLHATSDGVVVLMHDDTVDRTTNGTGKVKEKTFAELRSLDAGYRFTRDGGATFPFRGQGVVVPTLEEVLVAHPSAQISIEIKQATPSIVDGVIAVLDHTGAAGRVVVNSFNDDVMKDFRAKRAAILSGFAVAEVARFLQLAEDTEKEYVPPGQILQLPHGSITEEVARRADRLAIPIQAWTVNERADVDRLVGLRIHGIMTDDPEMLTQAYVAAGVR